MKKSLVPFAAQVVADRIGIAVFGEVGTDSTGEFLRLLSADAHPAEAFSIVLRLRWHTVDASFEAGRFSKPLIAKMGAADIEARSLFVTFVQAGNAHGNKTAMSVNGVAVDPLAPETWPANWANVEITMKRTSVDIAPDDDAQPERFLLDLVVPLFGMVASLIGVEENEPVTAGELEGRAVEYVSTRYERKKLNREACIQLKGTRCSTCGMDFAEVYGAIGVGYVEVHHVTPLSEIRAEHVIDVARDLVSLCANCHAMVHRRVPPLHPAELRALVEARRKARLEDGAS